MKIVVKVGTSTLAHSTGRLNVLRTQKLCETLVDLKNAGYEVILVSSGAIGMGVGKLGLESKPVDIPTKQAAAAVGQCELMYTYDKFFAEFGHTVAQILLTGADFSNTERLQNLKNTVGRLLELGVLPIVNENDTVATEEISVGDNDTLSAMLAVNVGADLLVILSDIDGLYTADPKKDPSATLVREVSALTDEVLALGGEAGSTLGTGGMRTKLQAARLCMENGTDMVIAAGNEPQILYQIVHNEVAGTRFLANKEKKVCR